MDSPVELRVNSGKIMILELESKKDKVILIERRNEFGFITIKKLLKKDEQQNYLFWHEELAK
jgi:hypothetical protein